MKKLEAISFEISNKGRLTISQNMDSLKSSHYDLINNIHWNSQLIIKASQALLGTIHYTMGEDDDLSTISLIEEHKYYVLIESDILLETDVFTNSFLNSIINWYPPNLFSIDSQYKSIMVGEFQTKGQIGIWDFSIKDIPNLLIQVASAKLDFDKEYSVLITDINEKILELTARFGNVNKLPYTETYDSVNSLFLESIHLQSSINEFLESLDLILRFPYSKNIENLSMVPLGTQTDMDTYHIMSSPYSYEWINGGPVSNKFRGFSPTKVNNLQRENNYDNYPNQFVKYVTEYFLDILYEIKSAINKNNKNSSYDIIRIKEVSNWIDEVEMRLHGSFINIVSPLNYFSNTSQVLEKKAGYQNITRIFDKLQNALHIDLDNSINFTDNYYSKPASDLYEIWCFLQVETLITKHLGQPTEKSIIQITNNRIKFTLKQGIKSAIKYSLPDKDVTLYYNYEFSNGNSYTIPYKPDITIEIKSANQLTYHHFDAKYKFSTKDGSFKEEDIWKMHAYKDGISNSKSSTILYPGTQLEFFKKEDSSSINAIPFKPGNLGHIKELQNFIISILPN